MPIPVEPAVLSLYVGNSSAETNTVVYVPWKNCQLSYAYTAVVTACTATSAVTSIDLELNAAGGTEMMSIEVGSGTQAVGVIDEATITDQSACENLNSDDAARDAVVVEVDGPTDANGAFMLYMYFEPWYGE
jgi:hypothetical protein